MILDSARKSQTTDRPPASPPARQIFLTGGTGYLGRRLIVRLLDRGHLVRALVRRGSEGRLPAGCETVTGDALDYRSFAARVAPADTFVQLVGTPHPGPAKAPLFRSVDLASALGGVAAAKAARIEHFVYVSVAHPAPVMRAYIAARMEAEAAIRASGLDATILRPWYVLGPKHWWPVLLIPGYALLSMIPATRESAHRLGLVTIRQMIQALVAAIEEPARGVRVMEVRDIRNPSGWSERAGLWSA